MLRVRNRYGFLRDLATLEMTRTEGTALGLHVARAEEHLIHEYCHATTLQLRAVGDLRPPLFHAKVSAAIEHRLAAASRSFAQNNEDRTLAAELALLHAFGLVQDEVAFLEVIASNLRDFELGPRVLRRLYGRRRALADGDARRVLRRIRDHARQLRAYISASARGEPAVVVGNDAEPLGLGEVHGKHELT